MGLGLRVGSGVWVRARVRTEPATAAPSKGAAAPRGCAKAAMSA